MNDQPKKPEDKDQVLRKVVVHELKAHDFILDRIMPDDQIKHGRPQQKRDHVTSSKP